MKSEIKRLLDIFWLFFKIGPVTFGGGYAMIPLIEKEVVKQKKWVNSEDLSDVFAIAGTVPGAIAVNAATIIGHRIAGIRGAAAATLGTILPTFSIVVLLTVLFVTFQENPYVEAAFFGIRASIAALIVYAAIRVSRTAIFDKTTFALSLGMLLMMLFLHWHPIYIIFSGALLGIVIIKFKQKIGMIVKFEKDDNDRKKAENIHHMNTGKKTVNM